MRRLLPSPGFVVLIAVYAGVVGFFVWGFSQPRLDRVWWLHHELKIGEKSNLKKRDRRLLEGSMDRYPALAGALVGDGEIGLISAHAEGWVETPTVVFIRTAKSKSRKVLLDAQTPSALMPYDIELEGPGYRQRVKIERPGKREIELPPVGDRPELVTLKLEGKRFRADPSVLGLRVAFCCEETAVAKGAR